METLLTLHRRPTNPRFAVFQPKRGRTPPQTRQSTAALVNRYVTDLLANHPLKALRVMPTHLLLPTYTLGGFINGANDDG
jgi:hypothetical protein